MIRFAAPARNSRPSPRACRAWGLGAALLFLSAAGGLAAGREPFVTWFYSFAWWSYILLADSLVCRRGGDSLIFGRFGEFLGMLPVSVTCWLIFEAANLALGNWRYVGVPDCLPLRWAGYWIAFATVLPGLFVTAALLESWGLFRGAALRPRPLPGWWLAASLVLGLFLLIFPLLQPRYGFPFIWLAFIFLLEPFAALAGVKSYVVAASRGRVREVLLLLTAGLVCGFLWEFWNYWAAARWVYTLPYFNYGRVFEMPVLGYLGFPPFAVEAAVMYNFARLIHGRLPEKRQGRRLWWGVQLALWLTMFAAIDSWTVASYRQP